MADPTSDPVGGPPDQLPSRFTDSAAERYNRRLGLALFALYLALYVAFVGIIFADYRIMARQVFAGLNLAIVYGFGLIIAAFVLALIYMVLCKREASDGR